MNRPIFSTLVAMVFALLPAFSMATPTQETPMSDPAAVVTPPVTPAVAPATPASQPAAVPEWLKDVPAEMHDSFKQYGSVAEALKAHQELRTKLSTRPPQDDGLSINPESTPMTSEDLAGFIQSAGLNAADIQKAWNETGKLTDEQYKAIAGKGVGKTAVNTILAMETELRSYKAKEVLDQATKIVGGQQQLETLKNWARQGDNLTAAEREWYNSQTNDPASAVRAVEWLNGKYQSAVGAGRATPLIEGGGAARAVSGFSTRAEIASAMNDPKYKTDRAYKEQVDRRVAVTEMNRLT